MPKENLLTSDAMLLLLFSSGDEKISDPRIANFSSGVLFVGCIFCAWKDLGCGDCRVSLRYLRP